MINYILVDDDESVLQYVKSQIDDIAKDYGLNHVGSFSSSKKANDNAGALAFDLLIVDYEMPVFNGVELAQRIAKSKKVIFLTATTNNEQSVINSVDIIGFLSKPFELFEFEKIIKNKILEYSKPKVLRSNGNYFLQIGSSGGVQLKLDETYFISTTKTRNGHQPQRNHVNIYGKNDQLLFQNVRCTIKQLADKLKTENFIKINQSTIINKNHLKKMDHVHVELWDTKDSFEVSKKEKTSFLQRFKNAFN